MISENTKDMSSNNHNTHNNYNNNNQLRHDGSDVNWVKMEVNSNEALNVTSNTNSMSIFQYAFTNTRSNPEAIHSCTFHLTSLNSDYIEHYLTDVSDPTSKNYGKYLTKQQIDDLTIDREGVKKVLAYLSAHDVIVTKQLSSSIRCESSIKTFELIFNTIFYDAVNVDHSNDIIYRAHEYYLPSDLVPHVTFVGGIMHLPVVLNHGPIRVPLKGQMIVHGRAIG
jgi:subtilase family serine protease